MSVLKTTPCSVSFTVVRTLDVRNGNIFAWCCRWRNVKKICRNEGMDGSADVRDYWLPLQKDGGVARDEQVTIQ